MAQPGSKYLVRLGRSGPGRVNRIAGHCFALITYSRHARERVAERRIRIEDVEGALKEPLELIGARYGRLAACVRLRQNGFLVVVYQKDGEDFLVVTAVKVNREGAERSGFTRV